MSWDTRKQSWEMIFQDHLTTFQDWEMTFLDWETASQDCEMTSQDWEMISKSEKTIKKGKNPGFLSKNVKKRHLRAFGRRERSRVQGCGESVGINRKQNKAPAGAKALGGGDFLSPLPGLAICLNH